MTLDGRPEEVVRHYYKLVDAGQTEDMLALFAGDCTYSRPGYPQITGMAQLRAFYADTRMIESGRHSVAAMVTDASSVAVRGVFTGTLKEGRHVEVGFADFFSFASDGKIRERHTFFDVPAI